MLYMGERIGRPTDQAIMFTWAFSWIYLIIIIHLVLIHDIPVYDITTLCMQSHIARFGVFVYTYV